MTATARALPFGRRLVTLAVYDVIERQNSAYQRDAVSGEITATVTVYGNPSAFRFSVAEDGVVTRLRVGITQPCPGLTRQGELRAVSYLADAVEQTLENDLFMPQQEKAERNKGEEKTYEAMQQWSLL